MSTKKPTTEEIAKNVVTVYKILSDAAPVARESTTLQLAKEITLLAVNPPFTGSLTGSREPVAEL